MRRRPFRPTHSRAWWRSSRGNPSSAGIYYDDTWNHDVFPQGTTSCTGTPPGGEVAYTEQDDINLNSIDAGEGLSGLPGSILNPDSNPDHLINPANLPVDPLSCRPIYPHSYIQVNMIFNVAHSVETTEDCTDDPVARPQPQRPAGGRPRAHADAEPALIAQGCFSRLGWWRELARRPCDATGMLGAGGHRREDVGERLR